MALNVGSVKAGARAAAHDRDRRQHAKNGYTASNPAQGLSPDRLHRSSTSISMWRSIPNARSSVRRLKVRPNPHAAKAGGPLQLDGEMLELGEVRLDRKLLGPKDYKVTPTQLTPVEAAGEALHARHHHDHQSRGQHSRCRASIARAASTARSARPKASAASPISSIGPTCWRPTRAASKPTRRALPSCSATAIPSEKGKPGRRTALRRVARSAPEALLSVRPRRRRSRRTSPRPSRPASGREGRSQDLCRARQGRPRRLGHGFAQALHAVGRGALRPRIRSRRVQHRRRVRLQHGRHGEQGPQHLQRPPDPGVAGDGNRRQLRIHRSASSRTSTSTTGPATASPAATGSSSASRKASPSIRDQEFSADERSRTVQRIQDVRQLRATQFTEDAGPLAHPVRPDSYIEINNFYTATVYEKGAELVRMIETILGADDVPPRHGSLLRAPRRRRGAPSRISSPASRTPPAAISPTSSSGIHQAGTPELVCALSLRQDEESQAELKVEQVHAADAGRSQEEARCTFRSSGSASSAPTARTSLSCATTDEARRPTACCMSHERAQTFRFTDVPSPPVPSLLRGFSAPVNLTISYGRPRPRVPDGSTISDGFNRWQAANTYATRTIDRHGQGAQEGRTAPTTAHAVRQGPRSRGRR